MSASDDIAERAAGAAVSAAARLARRLTQLYAGLGAAFLLFMAYGAWPIVGPPRLKQFAAEIGAGGMGAAVLAGVLLALAPLVATLLLSEARLWRRREETARLAGELGGNPSSLLAPVWRFGAGRLARQGQAVVLPLGFAATVLAAWFAWRGLNAAAPVPGTANLAAAVAIGLAFPSLIAERMMASFSPVQLPEAPGLRRLLLLATLGVALAGVAEIGRGLGFAWTGWVLRALMIVALVVAGELALRALAGLFLPPPPAEEAKAVSDSLIAGLLTGAARSPGALIRTHLGLDFARSWALSFLAAAAIPAVAGTMLFCWALSGVKLLGPDQRGIYERLGDPVAVLRPGLHVLLPWPLGRMRPVEYGTIHTIAVGADQTGQIEQISAEATPTAAMNHLWDTSHPNEAEYLVASQTEGQQGFQAVDAEILVLYRTGLDDAAAWQSVYGSTDQTAVVKMEASRLATRYFSSHTLDDVMGGQRESLQEGLRAELAKAVAADKAGVEIVAVLIEAIHPPAGAAAAYHAVQAAEINADAQVANASGHAARTAGEAQEEAQQALDSAQASAIEKQAAAGGDSYQFGADRRAYHLAPDAFLLERRAKDLGQAFKGAKLTIVDSHLTASQMPLLDLRPARAAPAPAAAAAVIAPAPNHNSVDDFVSDQPTPSTSTERPAPASTSEEQAEHAASARGGDQ